MIEVLVDACSLRIESLEGSDLEWKPPSHSDQCEEHRNECDDGLDNGFEQI